MKPATRNNALAGALLLGSAALAVLTAFVLGGADQLARSARYVVRFSVADGAVGLRPGSPVTLGGQEIGKVASIALTRSGPDGSPTTSADGPPRWIDVRVRVRGDIALYQDAQVFLERPLLGSLSSINIASVGGPARSPATQAPRLAQGGVVEGGIAPPSFLAQAGVGSEQVAKLRSTIDAAELTVTRLSQLIDRNDEVVESSLADFASMVKDLRARFGEWTGRVDRTAASLEEASARLPALLDRADQGVTDARRAIAVMQEALDRNRPRLDEIMEALRHAAARFDDESLDLLNQALRDGRSAMESLDRTARETRELVRQEAPALRKTLANTRLASDQLKLTMTEVRSQPWRLLYRPSTRELAQQLVYDAARTYAEAVSDLRAASESLQSAPEGAAPGDVADLVNRLREAFRTYEQAERDFLDRLIREERPGRP